MAAVAQEQHVNFGVLRVLNQALGGVADTLLRQDLDAMVRALDAGSRVRYRIVSVKHGRAARL